MMPKIDANAKNPPLIVLRPVPKDKHATHRITNKTVIVEKSGDYRRGSLIFEGFSEKRLNDLVLSVHHWNIYEMDLIYAEEENT